MYLWYSWNHNGSSGHILPKPNSNSGFSIEDFNKYFPRTKTTVCGKTSANWWGNSNDIPYTAWKARGIRICKECVKISELNFEEYLVHRVIDG